MGKGVVLRVLEGIELSPKLTTTLQELLPGYTLETYGKTPNYKRSIDRRIDSLYRAFLFYLEVYPLDPSVTPITQETIEHYVLECKERCTKNTNALPELHEGLEYFTAVLVSILSVCWRRPADRSQAIKEAVACLNEADCYHLMGKGRPDIATLTVLEMDGKKEYILQIDETMPAHYESLIKELEVIEKNKYIKTPAWFRGLSHEKQAYFCHLHLAKIEAFELMRDLDGFIDHWRAIKANSKNFASELNQIKKNMLPLPFWFEAFPAHFKAFVHTSSAIEVDLRELKSCLMELSTRAEFKKTLRLIPLIPQWYWVLSERQQTFLAHVLKSYVISDAVEFISSRLRTLPLPSNFASHRLVKLNEQGHEMPLFSKRYRSSHIASRDILKLPESVQIRHSTSNLAKVLEKAPPGKPILMQTLISPVFALESVPSIVTNYLPDMPDLDLFKRGRSTVSESAKQPFIWQHNHPYNVAKRYYYTPINDPDSLALLENAQKFVDQVPLLKELLVNYKITLNSYFGSATVFDYAGRELFLSSLEQLIVLAIDGYSYGSCVSGKDRKAIELMHTDAMILYFLKYNTWPKFEDVKEKRANFTSLFTLIYTSRHQHEHAGQNAPGSEGIKTPSWYLPVDMGHEINSYWGVEQGLIYDDRLATDNEVKNISSQLKDKLIPENEIKSKLIAKQLGEEQCTKLYDALSKLINEKPRFQSKNNWSLAAKSSKTTPQGISEIIQLMEDKDSGKTNELRLERIVAIVLNRPENGATRTAATRLVYDYLRALVNPYRPGSQTRELVMAAVGAWEREFEESKKEFSYGLA